jgi:hypothetical protein
MTSARSSFFSLTHSIPQQLHYHVNDALVGGTPSVGPYRVAACGLWPFGINSDVAFVSVVQTDDFYP